MRLRALDAYMTQEAQRRIRNCLRFCSARVKSILADVNPITALVLGQLLQQCEQRISRVAVCLRRSGQAHGVHVLMADDIAHQQLVVAQARPAQLVAQLLN